MKNLNISLVRNLVAVASLGAVLVSCGEGDVSQTDFGVRSTLDNATCGDGYVPFTYPARPIDPNTERYQSTATEDKTTVAGNMVDQTTVRLSPAVGINVNSADCGGASSSEDDAIRQACGGEKDCTYTATCSGAFKVSYGCGPGDVDSAGSQNVYTATIAANATKRDVSLSCKEVASVGTEAAPKSACIPQNCVGKARRDALLNCVPDKTMQTVYDTDIDVDGKRPGFISEVVSSSSPKSLGGSGDPIVTLTPEVPYRFDLRFRYKGEIPDNAKVTFWLADQWIPRSRQYDDEVRWDDKDSVYAYRCAALTVDVSKRNADADGWVSISQEEILANDCFRSRPVKGSSFDYISFALARKGFDSNQAVRVTTRVFHSFDVEGNTQYVERVGKTSVDETAVCQPNPLELFFDSRFDFYDYEGYYRQRQIDKVLGVVPQGVAVDIFPKGVTIGPKEMKLNVAQVTVTQHPIRSPSLPIDINWYVANLNQWTSFSPDYYGWGEKFPNDNRWTTGYGTAALPDLHANVYLWPRDATKVARIPVLAKVPLNIKESNANGSTVSVDVKMPTNTRRQFFNPSSPLYIPKDPGWRQYDVFYCIESGVPEKTVETRFFYPNAKLKYEVIDKPYWLRVGSGHLKAPAGSVYNEPGVYNPWNDSVGPGQGCRFAKEPLIVYADRFERPLTPASDSSFTGLPNEKGAGSSTMAATTDADSEMTCVGTNERECQEVTKNAMGSSGQMGRSFFSVHNGLDRDEGQDASVDGSAEALGFQVIDPSDPEEDDVSWGSSSTPVTMSITPPWDAIWSALKKLAARSPIKWAKGFFAALEGIGVGWGIEVPVQIGPIPGLITITFSVGVSLDLHAELQFAPEEGKDYPCIGNANCIQFFSTPMSQSDAADYCVERGGRLAEFSSLNEATEIVNGASAGTYWLGGQGTYGFTAEGCSSDNFDKSKCLSSTTTSFRWLSSDEEFASASAGNRATYDATKFYYANQSPLYTSVPTSVGLVFTSPSNHVGFNDQSAELPFVCEFDYATSRSFLAWKLGIGAGAAGGIGLSFCVPSDNPGICIGGSFNMVSLGIAVDWVNQYFWLKRGNTDFGRRGSTGVEIPWQLAILEGQIFAQINALFFSTQWTILKFDGFKLAEGKLLDFTSPVLVNY